MQNTEKEKKCRTLRLSHIGHCCDYTIKFDITEYNQPGINTMKTITITIHCNLEHLHACFNVLNLPPLCFSPHDHDYRVVSNPISYSKGPTLKRRTEAGYGD